MEEYSIIQLLEAAEDFAYYHGLHDESSIKEFLQRFPLPFVINALQTDTEVLGLEKVLVACLQSIFRTKYGASLIPQIMPFLKVGLQADSEAVKFLACETVFCLFENLDDESVLPAQLILAYDIYPLLLECLVNSDEDDDDVATASIDAITKFAGSPEGVATIFPAERNEATDLRHLAVKCSSLGHVRVLALIVELFLVSHSVASVIYSRNLLGLLETELSKTDDTYATLSILGFLFQLAEAEYAAEFLSKTSLLQRLSSIISTSAESILRSRAMLISGLMLSRESSFAFIDETSVLEIISAIERRLERSETIDDKEFESALLAIGQVGSSRHGAELLLLRSPRAVKSVAKAAFDSQRVGAQLAAVRALVNIAGMKMCGEAEESLQGLIGQSLLYGDIGRLLLSLLQQRTKIRFAAYRLISALVARPWCLMEICSKQEIIKIVTDAYMEDIELVVEARQDCCLSIHQALAVSSNLKSDPALAGIISKLQEAVKRSKPTITTEQRFVNSCCRCSSESNS